MSGRHEMQIDDLNDEITELKAQLKNCRDFIEAIPLSVLTAVHEAMRLKRLIKAASLEDLGEALEEEGDQPTT